jgi:hypothetical protein
MVFGIQSKMNARLVPVPSATLAFVNLTQLVAQYERVKFLHEVNVEKWV